MFVTLCSECGFNVFKYIEEKAISVQLATDCKVGILPRNFIQKWECLVCAKCGKLQDGNTNHPNIYKKTMNDSDFKQINEIRDSVRSQVYEFYKDDPRCDICHGFLTEIHKNDGEKKTCIYCLSGMPKEIIDPVIEKFGW